MNCVFGLIVKLSKLCNKTNRLECPVLCSVTLDQTTHLSLYWELQQSHTFVVRPSQPHWAIQCYDIIPTSHFIPHGFNRCHGHSAPRWNVTLLHFWFCHFINFLHTLIGWFVSQIPEDWIETQTASENNTTLTEILFQAFLFFRLQRFAKI